MFSVNETEISAERKIIHATFSLTIAIVGTFGNIMSLILIYRGRLYRASQVTMLIIDLCVANVISTGFIAPIIFTTIFYNWWPLSGIFCKLFGYIIYVAVCSECLIITNLALCHYLTVVHQVQIKRIIFNNHIYFHLFLLLGLPWVTAASCFLVPLTETWDTFGYDYRFGFCTLIKAQDGFGVLTAASIILVFIMSAVFLYCYPAILYTYLKSHSVTKQRIRAVGKGRTSHSKKLHFMISTIMISYLLTYLPYLIVNIIDSDITKTPHIVFSVITSICWSHAAINPFIYAILNTRINLLWRNLFLYLHSVIVSKFSSSNLEARLTKGNTIFTKTSTDRVTDDTAI